LAATLALTLARTFAVTRAEMGALTRAETGALTLGFSAAGVLATMAFLVVFRVLNSDFFWIDTFQLLDSQDFLRNFDAAV